MTTRFSSLALAACVFAAPALTGAQTPAPALPRTASVPNAKVYFVQPKNGDVVTGPVKVVMGLTGMVVAPAGTEAVGSGHHHLIVDGKTPAPDAVIPADATHRHFGKGQTETTLELPPGQHTLQLVFADKNHIPHNPPVVSEIITITVK